MPATTCPWCGAFAHMEQKIAPTSTGHGRGRAEEYQSPFRCANCSRFVIGSVISEDSPGGYRGSDESFWDALQARAKWFPDRREEREFPDVPPVVAAAAAEAVACLGSGYLMAAALMARGVVEATAKALDIQSGTLVEKIDQMGERGHVRPDTQAACHAIRVYGNDMAHGDFEPPERADVVDAVELMEQVLAEAFQSPARARRLKESAEARRNRRKSGETAS